METPVTEIMSSLLAKLMRLEPLIIPQTAIYWSVHALKGSTVMHYVRTIAASLGAAALVATLPLGAASEKIDYEALSKIKEQGLQPQNSKVMEISSWLTDVYGPRLTGSPATQKAGEWAVGKMKEWGLQNVALEKWPDQTLFPRGWSNDKFYMAAITPQAFPIPGTPTAWTPGTNGVARGDVILVSETAEADVRKYAGQLKGKWVLTQAAPDV